MPSGFPDYEYFEIPLPVAQGGTGLTQWPGARVYNSAGETVPEGDTALTFDSERYDNAELHSTSTNPSRLTAQQAGTYLITGHVNFVPASSGVRGLRMRLNGGTFIAGSFVPSAGGLVDTVLSVATVYHLAAGDYVELIVYQNSGGSLTVRATPNFSPEFAMQWVGP
jgi:hypothetical protein